MRKITILALFFFALATITDAGFLFRDPACGPVAANVHACSDTLHRGDASAVTSRCCEGLRAIEVQECALGVKETCRCLSQCLRAHFPRVLQAATDGTSITAVMKTRCNVKLSCL